MKFKLKVNDEQLNQVFDNADEVKSYLLNWNRGVTFEADDQFLDINQFFDLLKDELGAVSCYSRFMCEQGDNYVDVELVVVSE